MNKIDIINIDEFKSAVQESATEIKQEFPDLLFDYAGIIPNEDINFRYDCTPVNTTVFAMTGGDGVHYSILEISKTIQPIVMTVPMNFGKSINNYNWILAENLDEFLSLGYYNGWFPLEQLCYDQEWVIRFYNKENEDEDYYSAGDILFVKKLRKILDFEHEPLNLDRLKQLEKLFFGQIRFKIEFIEQLTKWNKS